MDGQNAKVIRSKTPDSKGATQGRNAGVGALQHTICRDCVLLLASRLFLDVGSTASNILRVDGVTATLAELDLVLELLTLIVQPLCDLSSAESKLSGAVADVEDGEGMLSRDFAGNRERPAARSRNGATSLVAKENFNKVLGPVTRGTYVEVEVKPMIPRIGAPSSRAVFALIST